MESVKSSLMQNRIYKGIDVGGDCWIWQGPVNNKGYGHLWWEWEYWTAHRFSYVAFKGPIRYDLVVRHTCHIRSCVNPEHLILGTPQDNWNDQVKHGTAPDIRKHRWNPSKAR
jgi:hypothetical protein